MRNFDDNSAELNGRSTPNTGIEDVIYSEVTYAAISPNSTSTGKLPTKYHVTNIAKLRYIELCSDDAKNQRARIIRDANKRLERW